MADKCAQGFLARLLGLVGQADQAVGANLAEDRIDVVFGVAVEPFEAIDLEHLTVATEEPQALGLGPFSERAVMALAGADERSCDEERTFLQ